MASRAVTRGTKDGDDSSGPRLSGGPHNSNCNKFVTSEVLQKAQELLRIFF